MKRVSSFLMAVCIFITCILTCALTAFAVGSFFVDYGISKVLDYFVDDLISSFSSQQAKIEAARSYFFYKIVNNKYGFSYDVFISDGSRFTDDYLEFVFIYYYTTVYKNGKNEYDSNGDVFLSAAGFPDTPFSLKELSFLSSQLINSEYFDDNDVYIQGFGNFKNYYQTYLARYILEQGGQATDPNPGKSGLDIAPGYVSSDDLKDQIEKDNSKYTPKAPDLFFNSYRTDTNYHRENYPSSGTSGNLTHVTLFQNPQTMESLKDLYCLPFYKADDGTMYYANYLFHFYYVENDDPNSDIALRMDSYIYNESLGFIYDDNISGIVAEFTSYTMPYQIRCCILNVIDSRSYKNSISVVSSLVDYANWRASTFEFNFSFLDYRFYASDYSSSIKLTSNSYNASDLKLSTLFYNGLQSSTMPYSVNKSKTNDYGFICSEHMISTVYSIDSSRIPSGQVVQVTGDSNIYNYYITNPDTGQSSTVNNFVENNYTYITNEGEGSGGTGGGVGGDINVGGKVEVEGDIHVDVDVNVNQGGIGGVNPGDFIQGDLDLGNYYDDAVSMTTGFRSFMELFFGFLPADLVRLLGFLIAVSIVCRLLRS